MLAALTKAYAKRNDMHPRHAGIHDVRKHVRGLEQALEIHSIPQVHKSSAAFWEVLAAHSAPRVKGFPKQLIDCVLIDPQQA